MKGTSAALKAHMAGTSTTMSMIVKITRKDGFVLAVTEHDVDIVFGGLTYKAGLGMSSSNVEMTAELNVDNLEVTGFMNTFGITEQSIVAGLWDFAEVRVSRVNWADLTMGDDKIKAGWLGQISIGRNTFTNEIRGLTQKLQQVIGESYSPSCKADLFDDRCKVVATEGVWKFSTVAVTTIVEEQRRFTSSALTQAGDFFTAGKLTWTSGQNVGLSKEIKQHAAGGDILLQEPMPFAIAAADQFTIFAGCQKRWELDCIGKFNNGKNHRGFPFLPGEDVTLRGY